MAKRFFISDSVAKGWGSKLALSKATQAQIVATLKHLRLKPGWRILNRQTTEVHIEKYNHSIINRQVTEIKKKKKSGRTP